LQLFGSESFNFLSSDTYKILILHFVLQTNVGMVRREIWSTRGEGARKICRHKRQEVQRPLTMLRKYT